MKRAVLISGFFLIPVVAFLSFCKVSNDTSPHENYQNYCATCHGPNMERFVGHDWKTGSTVESLSETIKNGNLEIGMPAFKEALSDKEINELANYILTEFDDVQDQEMGNPDLDGAITSQRQTFSMDTLITGLSRPWGMAFLPNGDIMVTERSGELFRFNKDGNLLAMIEGVPQVYARGQGGLMDIVLHPNYEQNGWIYISYSTSDGDMGIVGGNTAVMRAKLANNTLVDKEVLFKAQPDTQSGVHFGSRIVFDGKGHVYISTGERGNPPNAQTLENHSGKVHRINEDGSIPDDNPFVDEENAVPSIYSYGHRNIQGMIQNPVTGNIITHEHGPKGGDELNLIKKGANYGWPEITFGINYDGTIITKDTAKAGMEQPLLYWVPSIAPCGMIYNNSNVYPGWKNNLFIGSLKFRNIERVAMNGDKVVEKEVLLDGIGRVRNVAQGPDGYIYVAAETPGFIVKLIPE